MGRRDKEEDRPQRIIFQPSKEANEKLARILETNKDITLSHLMNLIIMDIPDDTKVVVRLDKGMPA